MRESLYLKFYSLQFIFLFRVSSSYCKTFSHRSRIKCRNVYAGWFRECSDWKWFHSCASPLPECQGGCCWGWVRSLSSALHWPSLLTDRGMGMQGWGRDKVVKIEISIIAAKHAQMHSVAFLHTCTLSSNLLKLEEEKNNAIECAAHICVHFYLSLKINCLQHWRIKRMIYGSRFDGFSSNHSLEQVGGCASMAVLYCALPWLWGDWGGGTS